MPRPLSTTALVLALAAAPLLVPGAAAPADARGRHQPVVSISLDQTEPEAGERLRITGTVSGPARGARVRLQEQQSGPWRVVAAANVKRSGRYGLAARAVEGVTTYRVQVLRDKRLRRATSASVEVLGHASQGPPLSFYTLRRLRLDLGDLVGTYRDERGLSPWRPDSELHDYAQRWSTAQAEQGTVLTRTSFEDAPDTLQVTGEHATLSGTPTEVMADLETYAADLLRSDALWLGIGMARRDDETGYWTITLATDAPETPGPAPDTEAEVRRLILEQTNDYRAEHGLAPLLLMDELTTVAQDWSRHMADNDDYRHNPTYSQQYPPGWRRAGENIAGGYSEDAVVDAWYDSPGHQANMLGDYTHIGIGYATNPDSRYRRYYTQNFARY